MAALVMPAVCCVLRSGGDFRPEHVRRLWTQVREIGRLERFVALSDTLALEPGFEVRALLQEWPGWWSKLELCAPEQDILGDVLYLDLDTTVVGPLDEIAAVGRLTMLSDFERPMRPASGVMYLPVEARQEAWAHVQALGAERIMAEFHRRGDQHFFGNVWGLRAARWQTLLPKQIASYKRDVLSYGGLDPRTRLICFHGRPRPWEVA